MQSENFTIAIHLAYTIGQFHVSNTQCSSLMRSQRAKILCADEMIRWNGMTHTHSLPFAVITLCPVNCSVQIKQHKPNDTTASRALCQPAFMRCSASIISNVHFIHNNEYIDAMRKQIAYDSSPSWESIYGRIAIQLANCMCRALNYTQFKLWVVSGGILPAAEFRPNFIKTSLSFTLRGSVLMAVPFRWHIRLQRNRCNFRAELWAVRVMPMPGFGEWYRAVYWAEACAMHTNERETIHLD